MPLRVPIQLGGLIALANERGTVERLHLVGDAHRDVAPGHHLLTEQAESGARPLTRIGVEDAEHRLVKVVDLAPQTVHARVFAWCVQHGYVVLERAMRPVVGLLELASIDRGLGGILIEQRIADEDGPEQHLCAGAREQFLGPQVAGVQVARLLFEVLHPLGHPVPSQQPQDERDAEAEHQRGADGQPSHPGVRQRLFHPITLVASHRRHTDTFVVVPTKMVKRRVHCLTGTALRALARAAGHAAAGPSRGALNRSIVIAELASRAGRYNSPAPWPTCPAN